MAIGRGSRGRNRTPGTPKTQLQTLSPPASAVYSIYSTRNKFGDVNHLTAVINYTLSGELQFYALHIAGQLFNARCNGSGVGTMGRPLQLRTQLG